MQFASLYLNLYLVDIQMSIQICQCMVISCYVVADECCCILLCPYETISSTLIYMIAIWFEILKSERNCYFPLWYINLSLLWYLTLDFKIEVVINVLMSLMLITPMPQYIIHIDHNFCEKDELTEGFIPFLIKFLTCAL